MYISALILPRETADTTWPSCCPNDQSSPSVSSSSDQGLARRQAPCATPVCHYLGKLLGVGLSLPKRGLPLK